MPDRARHRRRIRSGPPQRGPWLHAGPRVSNRRDTVTQHRPPVGSVASPKQLAPVRDSPFGPACTARNKWDPIGSRRPGCSAPVRSWPKLSVRRSAAERRQWTVNRTVGGAQNARSSHPSNLDPRPQTATPVNAGAKMHRPAGAKIHQQCRQEGPRTGGLFLQASGLGGIIRRRVRASPA